jgi:hypothetical protein
MSLETLIPDWFQDIVKTSDVAVEKAFRIETPTHHNTRRQIMSDKHVVRSARFSRDEDTVYVVDTTNVVRAGEMTQENADAAFLRALKEWGLEDSSESERKDLINALVLAAIESTSGTDENLRTRFKLGTDYYDLRPLAEAVRVFEGETETPLRVFFRSYQAGELAVKAFNTLAEPANAELRQSMALRTGLPVSLAPYGLDIIDAVVRHSGIQFSHQELCNVREARRLRTDNTRGQAVRAGERPVSEATNSAKNRPVLEAAPPIQDVASRIGFMNVR